MPNIRQIRQLLFRNRSGSGAINPLTQSPYQWFKPESLVSIGDGNNITSWADSSGNGRNGTGTGVFPICKTNIANGYAVARFADAAGGITLGDFSALTEGEVFMICRSTAESFANDNHGTWISCGTGGSQAIPSGFGTIKDNFGRNATVSGNDPSVALTSFFLYNAWSKTSDWSSRLNNLTDSANSVTSASNTPAFNSTSQLGRDAGFGRLSGDIAEYIFFATKRTTQQRADMVSYFSSKYNLGLS